MLVALEIGVERADLGDPLTHVGIMRESGQTRTDALDEPTEISTVIARGPMAIVIAERTAIVDRVEQCAVQRRERALIDAGDAVAEIVEIIIDRFERRDRIDLGASPRAAQKRREDDAALHVIRLLVDRGQGLCAQGWVGDRGRTHADRGEAS